MGHHPGRKKEKTRNKTERRGRVKKRKRWHIKKRPLAAGRPEKKTGGRKKKLRGGGGGTGGGEGTKELKGKSQRKRTGQSGIGEKLGEIMRKLSTRVKSMTGGKNVHKQKERRLMQNTSEERVKPGRRQEI